MKEFERYLRYVIPGLVFIILLILFLALSNYDLLISKFNEVSFSKLIVILFSSGGIVYIFSTIYWTYFRLRFPLDHTKIIDDLDQWVTIVDTKGIDKKISNKQDAWSVLNTFWYWKQEKLQAIDSKVDRMSDITHGLGTTFIAMFISLPAWALIRYDGGDGFDFILYDLISLFIWVVLLLVIRYNYLSSLKNYKSFIDITFANIVKREFDKSDQKKVEIVYPEN
ncbi:MAG: hypothetical protein IIA45_14865 [Bacteroidetes bacterium]|nr:hypothetical protein [Bacteroidota bacterium]